MAHISKATRLQAMGLFRHDLRLSKTHSNKNIDPKRTPNNFNYIEDPIGAYQKRLSEVYVLNRKDVNTLCEIVISLPKDVKKGDAGKFFKIAFDNACQYFGTENVVSGALHQDETTPHLHIKAIPVYYNEKKQREQVSFDKKCPRSFYQNYHKELSRVEEKFLGYKVSVLNEDNVKRNLSLEEFKKQNPSDSFKNFLEKDTLKNENEKLKTINQELEQQNNELSNKNYYLQEELDQQKEKYSKLQIAFSDVIEKIQQHVPDLHNFLYKNINIYKTLTDKTLSYTRKNNDYELK